MKDGAQSAPGPGVSKSRHRADKMPPRPESPSPETVVTLAETSDLENLFEGHRLGPDDRRLTFELAPPGTLAEWHFSPSYVVFANSIRAVRGPSRQPSSRAAPAHPGDAPGQGTWGGRQATERSSRASPGCLRPRAALGPRLGPTVQGWSQNLARLCFCHPSWAAGPGRCLGSSCP